MKETMKRWARVFRRGKQIVWMGRNRFSESILEETEGEKKEMAMSRFGDRMLTCTVNNKSVDL